MSSNEISCKPTSNGKRLCVYQNEIKLYSIDTNTGILKVAVDREQLIVWTKDSKKSTYALLTGQHIETSGHDGNNLIKSDRAKRKQAYISRQENEKRGQTSKKSA